MFDRDLRLSEAAWRRGANPGRKEVVQISLTPIVSQRCMVLQAGRANLP